MLTAVSFQNINMYNIQTKTTLLDVMSLMVIVTDAMAPPAGRCMRL